MTNERFDELFGGPPRAARGAADAAPHGPRRLDPGGDRGDRAAPDARARARRPAQRNLCLAGGVALNCVANGKVLRDGAFDDIWIQPAAGDAGGALGAALAAYHLQLGAAAATATAARRHARAVSRPELRPADDRGAARAPPARAFERARRSGADRRDARRGARRRHRRSAGSRGGWSSARARSARARSSAIARSPDDADQLLNLKVKYRESFRPFAPAVLREDVADWFELDDDSPYMLLVADVRRAARRAMTAEEQALFGIDKLNVPRSDIPAVTHVDYSARIQTVHRETNPRFHALISRVQAAHRLPGARQHELQRARRADRVHAGGRVPLLHGHRDRLPGGGELPAAQGRPGPGAAAALPSGAGAGLSLDGRGYPGDFQLLLHCGAIGNARGVLGVDARPVGADRERPDRGREAVEQCVVAPGDHLPLADLPVEALELRQQDRALDRVESPVDPDPGVVIAARLPVVADLAAGLSESSVVGEDGAAVAVAAERLRRKSSCSRWSTVRSSGAPCMPRRSSARRPRSRRGRAAPRSR